MGRDPAATSGARKPIVPRRRARGPAGRPTGVAVSPRSTSTTRPLRASTRFAGETSPCTTAGSAPCMCPSASPACASQPSTEDTGRPGRPRSASRLRQSDAVDPVHDQHVRVVEEEVVANQRQPGMRGSVTSARASESRAARSSEQATDLQGHLAAELVVVRPDHPPLTAAAELLHAARTARAATPPSSWRDVVQADRTRAQRTVGQLDPAPPLVAKVELVVQAQPGAASLHPLSPPAGQRSAGCSLAR